MPKYKLLTYGCQMNYSDSERMETYLGALGLESTDDLKSADIILLNTCSIKQKAEDKVLGKMREIQALPKNPIVIVTGCMVRKSSSKYSEKRDKLFPRIRELDIALKTEELPQLAGLLREIEPDFPVNEIPEESLEDYLQIGASPSSSFIAISNGCDKFCTYCIVPYARGREKSRPIADILKEAEGKKEVTLIGQTVNSYGKSKYDEEKGTFTHMSDPFAILLGELDKIEGLERVRFTSPHPKDMTDELITAMADLRTQQPYLHLPIQSGHNEVLKRMNRPYTVEHYREIVRKLREAVPGISISTDFIVGFCGETEEEFNATLDLFIELKFEHAYISPYSDRKGTTASKFMKDDIPTATKNARFHAINNQLKVQSREALDGFIGKTVNVLVESCKNGVCSGRSENFKTVQFPSETDLTGEIVPVRVTETVPWVLLGERV